MCYRHVIAFVEADVAIIELIKVSGGCVEHQGGGWTLVPIHYGGVELREGDGAEHLLALDGVHADPVEVVRLDLHVWGPEQDDCLVVQLLGDQIHELQVGGNLPLCLHRVPQQVAGRLASFFLVFFADLKSQLFHLFKEVIVVVFLWSIWSVEKNKHQEYPVILLNRVLCKAPQQGHCLELNN